MKAWLRIWWPALAICAAAVAIIDGSLSSLLTCHPVGHEANPGVTHQHQQECTAFAGPVLSTLIALLEFFDDHGDAAVAAFTAVLAIFTARLWVSTDKLWAAATKADEARAAETQILQRAYLSIEPGGLSYFESDKRRLACDIEIENAGNLPARNVGWFITRDFSTDESKMDFPLDQPKANIVIPPKVRLRKGARSISVEDIEAFNPDGGPRARWLYVWGQITYYDGFRHGRFVRFCHRYNLNALSEHWGIFPVQGRFHESGNGTDEE